MEIKLGLHQVDDFTVYHISSRVYNINETYYTTEIEREYDECSEKKWIERLAERWRNTINYGMRNKLPSRYSCLFVCEYENVWYWWKHIREYRQVIPHVYKLKVTGKLFGTYADYLKQDRYWRPNEKLVLTEKEGLFEGKFVITDICDIDVFPIL